MNEIRELSRREFLAKGGIVGSALFITGGGWGLNDTLAGMRKIRKEIEKTHPRPSEEELIHAHQEFLLNNKKDDLYNECREIRKAPETCEVIKPKNDRE